MHWSKWIVVALGLLQGAWLTFDGSRALVVGDYLTPSSGPGAGQLGPWSRIVAAIGLEPRSAVVKWLHVLLGVAWLVSVAMFWFSSAAGWWCVVVCAVGSLWYAPIGTVASLIVLGLMLTLLR